MRQYIMLLVLMALTGCATEYQFIPTGNFVKNSGKPIKNFVVLVYDDPADVPWPYQKIGEIVPEEQPKRYENPKDQVSEIQKKALEIGADAVIINRENHLRGHRGNTTTRTVFNATAIVKKE